MDAGKIIMKYYHDMNSNKVVTKTDNTPVTTADLEAGNFIKQELKKRYSDIPVICEEDQLMDNQKHDLYWLVDPLDGTKDFINGGKDFTVNIALIKNNCPYEGVVYVPTQETLYYTHNENAYRSLAGKEQLLNTIANYDKQLDNLKLVTSNSYLDSTTELWIKQFVNASISKLGSSIKLCYLAKGKVDIYPRFAHTMEWDTAAGHAILNRAGGYLLDVHSGKELVYSKPKKKNGYFIAVANKVLKDYLIQNKLFLSDNFSEKL